MVFILQQNHPAAGFFDDEFPSLLTVQRNVSVRLLVVVKPKLDCFAKYATDFIVNHRKGNLSALDGGHQRVLIHERRGGHLQIEACVRGRNPIVRRAPVGHQNAIEAPFLFKDHVVQKIVLRHVSAVDQIVGIHNSASLGLFHGSLERGKINFPQRSFVYLRAVIQSAILHVVCGEMLHRSNHVL